MIGNNSIVSGIYLLKDLRPASICITFKLKDEEATAAAKVEFVSPNIITKFGLYLIIASSIFINHFSNHFSS